MNIHLRELLLRIPPSPETDELQGLLAAMEKTRREGFESWWQFEGKDIEDPLTACRESWVNGAQSRDY